MAILIAGVVQVLTGVYGWAHRAWARRLGIVCAALRAVLSAFVSPGAFNPVYRSADDGALVNAGPNVTSLIIGLSCSHTCSHSSVCCLAAPTSETGVVGRELVTHVEEAWDALLAVTPAGWYVGRSSYHDERDEWLLYAFDPTERPVTGARSREWT